MKSAPLLLIAALAGCAAAPPAHTPPVHDGLAWARFGETVYVDGPKVTPLTLVEDSRCPPWVECVWAGSVRITARIDLGARHEMRELSTGKPIPVADGTLELVDVTPPKSDKTAAPYRFGFRFMGGL